MEGTESVRPTMQVEPGTPAEPDFSDEAPRFPFSRPDATPEELEKASFSDSREVKEAVAQHKNTQKHVLAALWGDRDSKVRTAVMRNPNTPEELLEEGLKDRSAAVRAAARQALETRR